MIYQQILNQLNVIRQKSYEGKKLTAIHDLMNLYWTVFIEMHTVKIDHEEKVDFVKKSAPLMEFVGSSIDLLFIPNMENNLLGEISEGNWLNLCKQRSALETIRDLYKESAESNFLSYLNTDNLDLMLKERGQQEGYDVRNKVPFKTPEHHWWWYLI